MRSLGCAWDDRLLVPTVGPDHGHAFYRCVVQMGLVHRPRHTTSRWGTSFPHFKIEQARELSLTGLQKWEWELATLSFPTAGP